MKTIEQLSLVSAAMYALAAGLLAVIAVAMMAIAMLRIWQAFSAGDRLDSALLESVGLIIVAVAVIDVSKIPDGGRRGAAAGTAPPPGRAAR